MWYLNIDNNREGPLDDKAVADLAAQGRITGNTFGWKQGMAEWLPLQRTELAHLFAPAPAPGFGGSTSGSADPSPNFSTTPGQGYGSGSGPAPVYGPGQGGAQAPIVGVNEIKNAGMDAWNAFKMLMSDPVGRLAEAFQTLGQARALGVGIVFGVVSAACMLVFLYSQPLLRPPGFTGFLKAFFVSIVPFASLVGATLGARSFLRGQGTPAQDCFLAGVGILPMGLAWLLSSIVGLANFQYAMIFFVMALSLVSILLFAGLHRLCGVPERLVTLTVPLILVAAGFISRLIYGMVS